MISSSTKRLKISDFLLLLPDEIRQDMWETVKSQGSSFTCSEEEILQLFYRRLPRYASISLRE